MTKKEELEKAVLMLEERVKANKTMSTEYENDLAKAQKDLADFDKPVLTPIQLDAIHSAIEKAVERFDFNDTDNFEIDYSLDYDGKVQCESHEFNNSYNLVDEIVTEVCDLFKEADCSEEELEANSSFGND